MLSTQTFKLTLACAFLAISTLHAADRDDIVIADFESESYGNWKITGEAFGPGPAKGTLPDQMPVSGFEGERLVNSYFKGDGTTGTLTSPPIRLERKFLNFLIGGGQHPGETCINLKIGDKIVRTASGPNDQPGGSEQLEWHTWDVAEFAGQTAVIEIVDRHTGGWGHINVDQIVQSDRKLRAEPKQRVLTIEKRYLHLPVQTGATQRRMKFLVDGHVVREFDIELRNSKPVFHVFADVSAWKGKSLTVAVDRLPAESTALEAIVNADEIPDAANIYREKHRPQFHFTSRRGWLNDPNGLVYLDGEYHLYYQHNPYGWNWGNMHWGHAVSKDLLHWEELPLALVPPRYGDWCFSGSAVVDVDNTTGLKKGDSPVLVAAFTSTGRGECLAYSRDRGRTWTEFSNNPVVKHVGRDPRLVWHAPTKSWVMAVYTEAEGKRWIAFHTSKDMQTWTFRSRIEEFFECPDLFELPVAGRSNESRWVLYGADGEYILGTFDGEKFQTESGKHKLWHGRYYAAQTFSNAPDGRRIQIGWGNGITFPNMPFNQQMTIPVELTLRETADGLRMFATPVKELETLRTLRRRQRDELIDGGSLRPVNVDSELLDVETVIEPVDADAVQISLCGHNVVYDAAKQSLKCGDQSVAVPLVDGQLRLRILVDRGSVEIFAHGGRVAISVGALIPGNGRDVWILSRGKPARLHTLDVYELRSTWR